MDNSCIIGYGTVGKAFAQVFGIKKIFTKDQNESNITLEEASKCRLVFVCLPTPVRDGEYYTKDIEDIIVQMEGYGNGPIYVIRSTVYPGFAIHLQKKGIDRAISNPEFLSEATAVEDTKNAPFVLIGGFEGVFRAEVRAFYQGRLKGSPIIECDNTTAELAKLALNSFFATKVIFANQLYDACELTEANYQIVKRILEKHPYGSKNHFSVWFRDKRGVHGKCLPKDSEALAHYGNLDLIRKVVELNKMYVQLQHG